MKKLVFFFITIFSFLNTFSQKGKNGAGNIVASTVVNAYTSLSADAFIGNISINVASAAGYAVGDLVYIIQMQGASVNCYIWIYGNPNAAYPLSPDFGKITNYNNAGNNEYAEIASISGNVITLDCPIKNNYTAAGKVQVIKVPRYTSLTIGAAGIITCPTWNGTTGGVIAIEVDGNTTIAAGGKIDASGLGFRGGILSNSTFLGAGSWSNNNPQEGAYKGESIAGDVATYLANFQGPYCKGAVANGGGGSDANNGGGGGGANAGDTSLYNGFGNPDISVAGYVTAWNLESPAFASSSSSGGGRGGYTFSNANMNPLTVAPAAPSWAGDARRQQGGMGGRPLDYNTGRLFCGGGGGAGDENDSYGGAGGNGGGIINILSYGTISGGGQILSNGANGFNTSTPTTPINNVSGRDGAGGAGGGGAIFINSSGSINTLTLSAKGGNGGNQQMKSGTLNSSMAYGPGAGGGGGYIGTTAAAITTFVNGGVNGIVQYLTAATSFNSLIVSNFAPNGATSGGSGTVTSTIVVLPTITACPDLTICVNNSAVLTATTNATGATISWYSAVAGGTILGTGSVFTTSVFTTPGTYTVAAGFCPSGIYRDPVVITVTNGPTLTPVSTTVCAGQTGTISVSGATTYTWSTGANTQTITATPAATTVYTVTGSIGTCTTSTTATITVNTSSSLSVGSSTICSGQTATLTAGTALSYTWSTGANTATVSLNPATTTVYTVNATLAGGCVVSNTTHVVVNTTPVLIPVSTTICAGQQGTISVTGATNYIWSTGASSSSISASPLTTTNYSVVGANGTCTSSTNATITVNPNPIISVVNTTVCAGQSATITASGAASYTWSTGANTPTLLATPPATTVYTVTGANGTCTSSATGTITVNTIGTLSVNSPTICSGQTAFLSAGAATSYSWSTGANTATVSVSPLTTTIYTVNVTLAGGCTTSATSTVTVNSTPTLSPVSATICAGQTGTLSITGATSYTWSTGSNSSSITATPAVTTTYTVTGANGTCTSSATASISVGSVASIAITSATICVGQTTVLSAAAAASYTWSTGANTQTISVNPATTTVYTLSAITSGGCNAVGSATVTVNTAPVMSVTNSTICAGQTGTLSASGATSYTWSTGANTASATASPVTNTTYTVTGANGSCTSSTTASITINNTGVISVTSPTICSGQSATLTAGTAASYTWSSGGNTQTVSVNPLTTSVYTINATLVGGCSASNTATVTVNPSPTVTANSVTICSGQSATLTANGATTYLWNDGTPASTDIVSPTVTTVYTVTGTSGNCSAIANTTVFVIPTPTLTAASVTVCTGQAATLTASGATSYTWDPSPGLNVVSSTFTVLPSSTTTYTVIGANGSCTAMATASVVIGSNLSISVNTPTICSGQTATLIAVSTATNYVWSNAATGPTIFVAPVVNTSYTVTGSKGACTGTTVANVVVNSLPLISVSANPVCAGGSATLTANGATTYSWSTGSGSSSINVTPASNTSYSVIGSNGSCSVASVYNLTISPTPTLITTNANICNGGTATLSVTGATNYTWLPSGTQSSSITVSPSANSTYTVIGDNGSCSAQAIASVSIINGLIAPVNAANICQGQTATIGTTLNGTSYLWSNGAITQSITVTPSSTINYSVLVVVGSCSYNGSSTITVIPTPTINLNSASICLGQTATLSATGASGGYTWNPGNLSGNSVTVSPTSNTNYIVTSANGICPATATTAVIVNTKPALTVSPADQVVCPGSTITYSATGAGIYEWYVNGNYHFGNPLTVTPTQNSTITLIGSNGGCSTTSVFPLNVSDVVASFKPESNYVDYPGTLTFTNTSTGATNIAWDFGNGQTDSNSIVTAYYENPGKYLVALVARNSMGCIDTALFQIEAGCGKGDFYIPNTFTPNGDGLNDLFNASGGSCVTEFTGSVFDRWGTEIFKWKTLEDKWDGSYNGKQVEIGVYNYLVHYKLYNGKVFTQTGHISVVR